MQQSGYRAVAVAFREQPSDILQSEATPRSCFWLFALALAGTVSLLGALAGCRSQASREAREYSDCLIVFPTAREIKYAKYHGTDQVTYKVQADYPADDVLSFISKQLKDKGWKALKEDYLNPGLPSSHVRGWTVFYDATTRPETTVHQWLAEWENETQDVVWYALQYRYPTGKPRDLRTLQVGASYIPAGVAKEMKRRSRPAP